MAKLLSVNVGLPREVEWQGKRVFTGIWKRSVPHRVSARRLNLDGDGQGDLAGHGGENRAVMVYQIDAYRYWEKVLGRNDFEYGQFGENFTVEGLLDNEVCIGDRYKIGSAVFEVSQPRVTCYRVGMRMQNPQMPALLVSHRKPGFYFRVITEGEVGAGDEIQKVAEGPGKLTVAEVDSLLYLPNHDPARLAVALTIPALSTGWKTSFDELLKADQSGAHNGNAGLTSPAPPPAWSGFRTLRVASVHLETSEAKSVVLESPDGSPLPAALPGQYLVLRLHPGQASQPLLRTYSISGAANSGKYRISVKRDTGPGSRYIVDNTQPGDMLEISAPRGEFLLRQGTRPVVFMSAGIGITPVLSMLYSLASGAAATPRQVWWLYSARNAKQEILAQEARQLLNSVAGSRCVIALSRPDPTDQFGKDFDIQGRLDLAALKKLALPTDADFYLCGPTAFQRDITASLISLGVAQSSIHQEAFGPADSIEPGVVKHSTKAPHPPASDPADQSPVTGPLVSFTRSNLSVPWDNRFKSLLEFAEACDVPVRYSCRTGVCHTCECGILSGKLQYTLEPLSPPAAGSALICCAIPESPIDLDL